MGATAAVHPNDPTLQAYSLGKLDDASAESVNKHLSSCSDCQRRVAEMSSDSFLGQLRGAQGAPETSATGGRSQLGGSFTDRGPAVAIAPPPVDTLPPELVDHPDYEIVRELGRGGMGVVYLVRNKLMGRLEVLKVVSGQLVERPGVRDRFLREVQSAAKLQHKNIVAAYSAVRLGESIALAMEYIDGEDLAQMVKSRGPLPVVHACYFIYQAALGLQHAHERGMVHRDIKPANLIFAREGKKGVVKVLDFGLAKVTSEGQADSGLTREGQMLGTPDYIAPEQIRDAQSADIRADIYSLGCTFYYLLTGGPPFRGDHLWDLYQAHFSMDAGPLNLVRPEVPVELAAVVAKMMAKEPGRRFQTPGEVARALTPFFKKGGVAVKGVDPEVSQMGQPEATHSTPATPSAPSRPAVRRTPAPLQPGSILEGLVDLRETDPLFDKVLDTPLPVAALPASRGDLPLWSTAIEKLNRLGPRAWWAAAGLLLLGFVVAWALVIRVKTANGMIELVDLPRDAEVLVDGAEVAITWPGGGKPAVITVTAGKHKIMVKKDGTEISGDEVTVQADGKETFSVRFVALTKPSHELPKDDGADSTPTARLEVRSDAVPAVKTPSSQDSIPNSIGMTLKLIPAGEFMMGSPDNDKDAGIDEKPQHRVRISKSFYLGVYEVTQPQYNAVMGYNPSSFPPNGDGKDKVAGQSTDPYPVDSVSWFDAVNFCNKLSAKEGRRPFYEFDDKYVRVPDWNGPGYRLPTEAEWEYACRANASKPTRYSFGDDAEQLDEYGWFQVNSSRMHPVGKKKPNGFGLHDMHGNVSEWCWDWYDEGYYKQSREDDPTGPAARLAPGLSRVIRGGGWGDGPRLARSASRVRYEPGFRYNDLGFRLALGQSGR
jgi:formylglycine-generating enzyme required for sulfatase activity/serine/threonine protein kinase